MQMTSLKMKSIYAPEPVIHAFLVNLSNILSMKVYLTTCNDITELNRTLALNESEKPPPFPGNRPSGHWTWNTLQTKYNVLMK